MPPKKRKAPPPRRRAQRIVVVRGPRTVRTAAQVRDAQGRFVSVPEEILWDVYVKGAAAGRWPALRGLRRQVPVLGYHLDFGLPERRLGVEVDGLAFHGGQEAWARDHARQRRIEAAGWRVTRFTAKEASGAPVSVLNELNRLWGGR